MAKRPKKDKGGKARDVKERLLAVRIPQRLLDELDEQLASMSAEAPWVQMTRSDAVRWLLAVALKSVKDKPPPRAAE